MRFTPFLHTFFHLVVLLVTVTLPVCSYLLLPRRRIYHLLTLWQVARADPLQAYGRNFHHNQLRHLRLQKRDLPTGWTSLGCYTLVIPIS